jgi:hypothetical protein
MAAVEEGGVSGHGGGGKGGGSVDGWECGWVGVWMGGSVDGWECRWVGVWMGGSVDGMISMIRIVAKLIFLNPQSKI